MKQFAIRYDKLEPRRKKVAIVGFASSTRLKAPYGDQAWEIWGENQLYRFVPRATRWFEMHPHEGPYSYLADMVPGTDYPKWLRESPIPVYMVSHRPEFPNSIGYPLQQMIEEFGLADMRPDAAVKGYFHSTVDYMLALAISEGFEEIGVWGVDMSHDTEYERQKPSGSFWLGVARGRGIKVTLPVESALLKNDGYAYGYDPLPTNLILEGLNARHTELLNHRANLVAQLNATDGSIQENRHWAEMHKQMARGSVPSPEQ